MESDCTAGVDYAMTESRQPRRDGPGDREADVAASGAVLRYLTIQELATRTTLSVSTLRRLIKKGKLIGHQPGGPRTRMVFRPDAIEQATTAMVQDTVGEPLSLSPPIRERPAAWPVPQVAAGHVTRSCPLPGSIKYASQTQERACVQPVLHLAAGHPQQRVYYADGRGNPQKVGRHSLGTRDRQEALVQLRRLDLVKATEFGLADTSVLQTNQAQLLTLDEGQQRYLAFVSRPAV